MLDNVHRWRLTSDLHQAGEAGGRVLGAGQAGQPGLAVRGQTRVSLVPEIENIQSRCVYLWMFNSIALTTRKPGGREGGRTGDCREV